MGRMPKPKKAAEDIAAYKIERLRKNAIGMQQFRSTASPAQKKKAASQKREQRQRASVAQKAVHALQEQQRHQKLSQEQLTKRTAQKILQRAQKKTTNAGTKWKAPRTVAEMIKAFWAQGDTYSAG